MSLILQRLPLASIDILLYRVDWVGLHASHIHSVSSLNCLTKERFRRKLIKVGEKLPMLHSHVGDFSHTQLLSGSFSRAHLLNVVMSMGFTGLGVQRFFHSSWFWLWLKESLVWCTIYWSDSMRSRSDQLSALVLLWYRTSFQTEERYERTLWAWIVDLSSC